MSVNAIKDKVQRAALNKWFVNGCKGTLEMATGVGKSRCGVLASQYVVKHKPDARILIITPTQTIRDDAWVGEFTQWGASELLSTNVEIQCIQTVYKWKNEHFDLIIADEVHNYVPDVQNKDFQYFKFFLENKFDKILALSASIESSLKPRLWTIAPIVETISTAEALRMGLIAPFKVFNLAIPLTKQEQGEYDKATEVFEKTFSIFTDSRGFKNIQVLFKCLNPVAFKTFLQKEGYSAKDFRDMRAWPQLCMNAMKTRKDIIYNAENKIQAVVEILEKFSDRRGIVFSQSIDFANSVSQELGPKIATTFHSKLTKKVKKQMLDDFNDLKTSTRAIISSSALNEGANLNDVSLAIIASGTSKEKDFIQRLGRAVRLKEGKEAYMIRLYVEGTKEQSWLAKSQENFPGCFINNISEINNEIYNQKSKEVTKNTYVW